MIPSLRARMLALPAWQRRLIGLVGLVIAILLLASGLGVLESANEPVPTMPPGLSGSIRPGTTR